MAFTNCEEVELYLNDRKIDRKPCDQYQQVTFYVPYEKGSLKAIGYKKSIEVIKAEIKTAKKAEKICLYLSKSTLCNDGLDSVAVNVYVVDGEENRVPDADNLMHFEVTGGAEIIGVGNGNPNSHEADVDSIRKLFNGYAQAILKNNGNDNVVVKVSSEGLTSADIIIPTIRTENIPYLSVVNQHIVDGWTMYYKLFNEMPDPNLVVDKNDMNSFEPVSFEGNVQPQFEGQYLKYGLYRTTFNFGEGYDVCSLYFEDIVGRVWVYANGKLIVERKDNEEKYLVAEISNPLCGEYTLTVIIQNIDKDWNQAGICSPVILKSK